MWFLDARRSRYQPARPQRPSAGPRGVWHRAGRGALSDGCSRCRTSRQKPHDTQQVRRVAGVGRLRFVEVVVFSAVVDFVVCFFALRSRANLQSETPSSDGAS